MTQDQDVAHRLARILGRHASVVERRLSWESVQERLGCPVHEDFKVICEIFPSGSFGGIINFYNPVQSKEWRETFFGVVESKGETFRYAREQIPEEFPHFYHPEEGGMVPWGHGDQNTYFWCPGSVALTTVFIDNHGDGWGEFYGTIAEFLVELFDGGFRHEVLLDNFNDRRFFDEFSSSEFHY
ncbi:hypothetical protein [Amycolatopsis sp. WAC 04182]|uniref:hypothetical protein n=1 Tax=Amycolatopsis sp. WAC 04182 TaxID=2203198 RepID=UPI000F7B43C0|nr:hypothetical protein [Amycolatopsis sp. WAC 04182]